MNNQTSTATPSNAPETAEEINFGKMIADILNKKWVVIFTTLTFCIIASIYAMLAVPVYKGNALIQVEQSSGGVMALDELGDMFAAESSAETEIYILKSRFIVGKAVDELNLSVRVEPHYFPFVGKFLARRHQQEGLATPKWGNGYAWGGEEISVAKFNVPRELSMTRFTLVAGFNNRYNLWLDGEKVLSGTIGETVINEDLGVEINVRDLVAHKGTHFSLMKDSRLKTIMALQKNFSAHNLGKDANIIELSLKGERKDLIASILNSLSTNYVLQNVQRLAAEAENSLAFLDEQIPKVRGSLNESERALNDFRSRHDSVDLTLETKSLLESLVTLEAEISAMAISEAEISRRFTQEHPSYVSFKRQQADLVVQRDRLNAKVTGLPETQQKILSLMRDFEVNQSIYLSLQNKSQELAIVKASTVGNVRILDNAVVFPKPSSPNRPLIVMLAGILGGMLSIIYVFIHSSLNRGITNPKDFQDIGLNLYAMIPVSKVQLDFDSKNKALKNPGSKKSNEELLLASKYPSDLAVEAVRSLRTSLHFSMLEAENNIVMISSAGPEVGKSFVTANTAVVFAKSGQKVLVVDADMRRGYMHDRLEMEVDKGLSNYLLNNCDIDAVVRPTKIENVDFISRGMIPPNPSELLMLRKFEDLLKSLSENYDVILIDTPPVLAVTDSTVVGRLAATNMLVSRFKHCSTKSVTESISRLALNGIDVKGVVFNAVETRSGGDYGYDYGYGYGYSYSYPSIKE